MKKFLFILMLLPSVFATAQLSLSADQWREDLIFLQETVNQEYPFLFKKITAEEWNRKVNLLHKQIPDLLPHQVVAEMAAIVASFGYGHTSLRMDDRVGFHRLPVNFYAFSDGIYIEGISKEYQQFVGLKVLKIESTPIETAFEIIRRVVPVENDQYHKAYGIKALIIPELLHATGIIEDFSEKVTLTLEKNGKPVSVTLKGIKNLSIPTSYGYVKPDSFWVSARNIGQTPLYLKNLEKTYYFESLPEENAVYVRQSSVFNAEDQSIEAFYNEVFDFINTNGVEKLIIDVRLNGGGNNYNNKSVITGIIENKHINQVGKLMVIIGRRTFSACQNLVNELSNYTNAVFIGEPTAENINFYGDNRPLVLPNSQLTAYLSFAWWQDKPQWENGPWTIPHIATEMTFKQYESNEDPVLEAALTFEGENFVLNPMRHIESLFMTGQIDRLQKEAMAMVKDPRYGFFNFEEQFNAAGENLMQSGRLQEAIFVFTMNSQLFPASAAVQEFLGKVYILTGDLEKAKIHLTQAITLDQSGEIAKRAEMKLRDLK